MKKQIVTLAALVAVILPLVGALCMVAVVGLHFYANVWYPMEHAGDPGLTEAIYKFRFVALLALLASSVTTVLGAVFLWMLRDARRRGRSAWKWLPLFIFSPTVALFAFLLLRPSDATSSPRTPPAPVAP
jgi:ABC-type Fe3+ transport system permease subunit